MSKLSAFLNPAPLSEEKEVIISDRFKDENGNVVPFKIRALSQSEAENIAKQATRRVKVGGEYQNELDPTLHSHLLLVAATVEPDFRATEVCQHYGVLDPSMVPAKMLRSGEYAKLLKEVTDLSGFGDLEGEVKN